MLATITVMGARERFTAPLADQVLADRSLI
jgi:hypothetical protein